MDTPESLKEPEQEIHKVHVCDLLFLSKEENERLISRIHASDGMIRVFVHPYYYEKMRDRDREALDMGEDELSASAGVTDASLQKLDLIYKAIPRIVKFSAEKGPPIIFFEEEAEIEKRTDQLEEMLSENSADSRIYLVPTFEDRATPRATIAKYEQSMISQDEENWPLLIERFKSLGVKKILLGGAFLMIDKNEQDDTMQYNYCLGSARNELAKSFDVELSQLTFPHGRREEGKYKQ